uniref:Fucosyltransferase n=1 Tax=Manihot esculenta TaxID=3983 RepID=A0A2C9W0W8_MANES
MRYYYGSRRRRVSIHFLLVAVSVFTGFGVLLLTLRSVDPPSNDGFFLSDHEAEEDDRGAAGGLDSISASKNGTISAEMDVSREKSGGSKSCATVEEMGESFKGAVWKESLRVRRIIQEHFSVNGASRIRSLPPEQFCKHGFVLGKASEAGFGNEMYKILNAAALSIMLNRSLIIGQTRGKYPFGDYISYTNHSFTLNEVKHLWRQNSCVTNYGRHLVMRIDDFEKPAKTNVLCSNWRKWEQPIIWFQNTTDAMASQFFLKNVYREMRDAASDLFGHPEQFLSRPNVFGELMKVLISPSDDVMGAVSRVLGGGADPDISLHMRMLMNRSLRATQAALNCIKKSLLNQHQTSRPRMVIVSDTPSFVKSITPNISGFAEVLYFDYEHFQGNVSRSANRSHSLDFRVKDWGPAPRWVAFVDFFLASRARHTVISGAHRRVGTTYAQLIAALAAANHLGENSTGSSFSFLSSFQSNLLTDGLKLQVGWGHVWNRFAGPLSCRNQSNQCALTPLLPPAWWDGLWQSPIPRDVHRLKAFGIKLSGFGTVDEYHLRSFCSSKKSTVKTVLII